ncbi:putative cytochrome P450 [Rosa chinensis]|uniref:Putative cytochrome P450 n=1 Tax=Rosa chinensis TaxID=74649 RepID=A0A2P6S778_ROSCH|nr:cytochrome P450 705A12 [Rosa chinensis]PRQ54542.1 putative cytochrome P450 [Rosa chinensis]
MAIILTDAQYYLFLYSLVSFVSILLLKPLFRKPPTNSKKPPPSPPGLPVIGHLHLLSSDHQAISFLNLSTKHGPLLDLRLGGSRMLLVSSASFAADVFKTQDLAFADRPAFAFADELPYGNSGFFGAEYGDYWKFMKKLCMTELFAPRQLERSRASRQAEIVKFCRSMIESGNKNEVVDVGAELMKMTNNSTCKMVMSTSVSEKGDEAARIREMMIKTLQLATKVSYGDVLGPLKRLGFWLYGTQLVDVSLKYDELLEEMLKDHEKREDGNERVEEDLDLADLLLKVYKDDKAELKITRTQIKAFLLDLFIGGTISSTETMQWAIAELINHPDVFKKVREEINSVLGNACRLVEETDIPSLPYLQAVVKEALRLYPPSPVVIRKSRQNCKIEGFDINQGTMVAINVYAIMRDPEIWDNPNEFRPERFLASSSEGHDSVDYDQKEQNFNFVAFGGGRRRCPGSSVALLLVNTAVAAMVQCFDWKVGEIGDDDAKVNVQIGAGISLPMASPLHLRPIVHFNPFASSM